MRNRGNNCILVFILAWSLCSVDVMGQGTIKGTVYDSRTKETLIGATVQLKGTTQGAVTDIDGRFSIRLEVNPPVTLVINFVGYLTREVDVVEFSKPIDILLEPNQVMISEVEVVGSRISEKTRQAPLTVESMDVIAIKEAPSGSFYESLGNLKGVDVTSASMGFKIINTRGFNSTSPVRSLQLIDGVDNQSPGLNFSLGNFLGVSDIDVQSVDIIAGASSAYYGPAAFNGVVDMRTKSPFLFPGLTTSVKIGERSLFEGAVRWADVIKNKEGKDKFGYKINLFYLTANDWEAENYAASDGTPDPAGNFSGWDAVNRYGDEVTVGGNDYSREFSIPGLGRIYRSGYREIDLADYDTRNAKANLGLYYKIKDDLELNYGLNYSTGTTVYQGDNRISLRNIQFIQNKIELKKDDTFFLRFYSTHEDAGDSYDIVQTAAIMSDAAKMQGNYYKDYRSFYYLKRNELFDLGMPHAGNGQYDDTRPSFGDYPTTDEYQAAMMEWRNTINADQQAWMAAHPDIMQAFNDEVRNLTENTPGPGEEPFFRPGTQRFDSLFQEVTGRLFTDNGSRFFDKSALYHGQGEYNYYTQNGKFTIGASGRLYTPDSKGTIFSDTLTYTRRIEVDSLGERHTVKVDSSYRKITNWEFGVYAGYEHNLINDQLQLKGTIRMDKNQNFDAVVSPALSAVYQINEHHTVRFGVSSALRNPTLADQYLHYDVGRAILIGNLTGFDSLATPESVNNARNLLTTFDYDALEYYDLDPIRPEKVRTFEIGYRGTLYDKVYVDATYYFSRYEDFIGYNIGVDIPYTPNNPLPNPNSIQVYRVAVNADKIVTTHGFSLGLNYYFAKNYALVTNFSWNKLMTGHDDPIIPAFNTPEFKFNVGVNARDLFTDFGSFKLRNWGFGVNYKWIDGFHYEGSPQFTGYVPRYSLLDAALSFDFKKFNTTLKVGASNLTDNRVYTVYGGPFIGRMAYFSLVYEWMNR